MFRSKPHKAISHRQRHLLPARLCKFMYEFIYISLIVITIFSLMVLMIESNVNTSKFSLGDETSQQEMLYMDLPKITSISSNQVKYDSVYFSQLQNISDNYKRPNDKHFNINVTASDRISISRNISDTRPPICQTVTYQISKLPKASIIIPFYNEALTILLRTIASILQRSPPELLNEIILIDDKSSYKYLHVRLGQIVDLLPKVRLIRNAKREGLIRSRLVGAEVARGPVLVFLDAHTECNQGWLEPILQEISRDHQRVVQPFVDGINLQTLEYAAPKRYHKGGFSWDLRFVWLETPDYVQKSAKEEGRPYWSPTLIGCAIGIHKNYFKAIGSFDEDLYFWGGENLELAFRVWMCGGSVITHPCSRVGHYFRELPYKSDPDWKKSWQKNLMRIAEIWMGDYKKYYYASTRVFDSWRIHLSENEKSSLLKRKQLQEKIGCKDFEWYLSYVIPEISIPPNDAAHHGEIMNQASKACWELYDGGYIGITFRCFTHKILHGNVFSLNKAGLLTFRDRCVVPDYPTPLLKVVSCANITESHGPRWRFTLHNPKWGDFKVTIRTFKGVDEEFCVWQVTNIMKVHHGKQMPQLIRCSDEIVKNNSFARWSFTYRFDSTV